ncbi:hypothetical protein GCM10023189_02210 [Nibrella saemangeumensis]|uniref:Short-chain dehydrogenase n=1 Tax=Nibrella saemangeumensis TaxID=1084526 RepID=A0ABP8MBJ8_9BACT
MNTETEKTALITGASSGIGRELTKLFAQDGYNLILVARSEDNMQQFADELKQSHGVQQVTVIDKDLSKENAAQELYDEINEQNLTVNVLVNDAGVGLHGMFATETNWEQESAMIHLNTVTLTHLTKLFLRDMVIRNEGRILNVASLLSIMPSPLMAVYAGTKAYVYNFSQSLVNELKDTNVTITALLPNATDTDFFNKAGAENTKVTENLDDPAMVAKDAYKALMKGESKVIPGGLGNKSYEVMAHLLPEEALAGMMRKNMEPKDEELDGSSKKSSLAWGIGAAAAILVGIAAIAVYNNASAYDRARYRYKFAKAKYKTKNAFASAKDKVSDAWSDTKHKVADTWSATKDDAQDTWASSKHKAKDNWSKEKAQDTWSSTKHGTKDAWSNVKDAVANALS